MQMTPPWTPPYTTPQRKPGFLALAHAALWIQTAAFTLTWIIPLVLILAVVVREDGLPDSDDTGWLLVAVILTSPLLLFITAASIFAFRFTRGRGGVHVGILIFEAIVLLLGGFSLYLLSTDGLSIVAAPLLLLIPIVLAAIYILLALLNPKGTAYFHRP